MLTDQRFADADLPHAFIKQDHEFGSWCVEFAGGPLDGVTVWPLPNDTTCHELAAAEGYVSLELVAA